MRVAVVTESFLPTVNGVTTSVCRVVEHLGALGHEVLVVCPLLVRRALRRAPRRHRPTVSVRSFPTGLPTREVRGVLGRFAPDVVHVASPFVLGARALKDAARLGVASVAVYQTDMSAYLASTPGRPAPGPRAPPGGGFAGDPPRRRHPLPRTTLAELRHHGVPRTARGPWRRRRRPLPPGPPRHARRRPPGPPRPGR